MYNAPLQRLTKKKERCENKNKNQSLVSSAYTLLTTFTDIFLYLYNLLSN